MRVHHGDEVSDDKKTEFGDTKPDLRSGYDRRSVDRFMGMSLRLDVPGLTTADMREIREALLTGTNVERAIALLDVAIALGERSGRF